MSSYRPTDNDVSTAERLAEQTQARRATWHDRPREAAPPAPGAFSAPEPADAYGPVPADEDEYSEVRQRERYGGLSWGAGFFGWLVAAGLAVVLSSAVAAGVAALGLTDQLLAADAEEGFRVEPVVVAVMFGLLLVAYYAGGYVAGRMSRFDGGKQGLAVWLTGLLLGGIGVGLGLLAGSRYGTLDQVRWPAMSIPLGESAFSGVVVAVAALFASLLVAVVGGKVGCRYHRKVDAAAWL